MKYKRYRLTFWGNPKVLEFLAEYIPKEYDTLRAAKEHGRAAELLFGVTWEWKSVTVPA